MPDFNAALAGILTSLILLVVLKGLSNQTHGARPPPGPSSWPFIGSLSVLKKLSATGDLVSVFQELYETFGPITQFEMMGEKQVILSSDKAAYDLFIQRGSKYSGRGTPYAVTYITDNLNVATMPKNDSWRRQRKLMHSAISIATNARYQSLMDAESAITLKDLLNDSKDFDRHLQRYVYGVICRAFFGIEVKSADDAIVTENEAFILEAMDCFRPDKYLVNVFSFLKYLPSWTLSSLSKMERLRHQDITRRKALHKQVEQKIKEQPDVENTFKHFLQNRDQYEVSDKEADSAFYTLLGGGTRSSHNALLGFLHLMMVYPEWQKKLHAEIDTVVGSDRLPTWSDIPNLPLVRAIVKEGIRYRSIKAELGLPHLLEEDDVYEGHFFQKGTVFHAYYGAILMDKEMYPDQEHFNPARWLEPSYPTYKEPLTVHPNLQNFTSFGYGRRACPGFDFAERTLVIMTAQIAWGFDISIPIDPKSNKPHELKLEFEPLPNPKPLPFPCKLTPRNQARVDLVNSLPEAV